MFAAALLGRSLARSARLFAGLAALLGAFQIALMLVASSFEASQSFGRLAALAPGFVQRSFGSTFATLLSFQGVVAMGYFHPIVIMTLVEFAVYLATEPAGEVESGLIDLLLSRPIARHWLITRSLILFTGCTMVVALAMGLATWAALSWLAPAGAPWPEARGVAMLAAHLVAVAWCFGALGLALAARARRRGSVIAAVSVTAVVLFLIDLLSGQWAPARSLGWLSPFHYYQGMRLLSGTAGAWPGLFILAAVTIVFAGLAYWEFGRRDL